MRSVTGKGEGESDEALAEGEDPTMITQTPRTALPARPDEPSREELSAQIELAQRIAREQPDDALLALRRMLGENRSTEGVA